MIDHAYVLVFEDGNSVDIRGYGSEGTAKGALKLLMQRREKWGSKPGRGRVFEVSLSGLTPLVEYGSLDEQVEGQEPLF